MINQNRNDVTPRLPIAQIRGAGKLIHDTVDGALNVIENVHQSIAQKPYQILANIGMLSAPIRRIEHMQYTITSYVYQTIRNANDIGESVASFVIDTLDRYDDGHKK
jgi:hypothetical protein